MHISISTMHILKFFIVIFSVTIISIYGDEEPKYVTYEKSGSAARGILLNDLLANYTKNNYPENATIKFGMSLLNVDYDKYKEMMSSKVWIRMSWLDNRLAWDPKKYGVGILRLPSEEIWLPDIVLYNGVKPEIGCLSPNAIIYSMGVVVWVAPCSLKSYCNFTLDNQSQECELEFGSWTFDGLTMDFVHFDETKKMALLDNYLGHKYKIVKNVAVKNEKKFDCCPEPYYTLKYTFGFTKQTDTCNKE